MFIFSDSVRWWWWQHTHTRIHNTQIAYVINFKLSFFSNFVESLVDCCCCSDFLIFVHLFPANELFCSVILNICKRLATHTYTKPIGFQLMFNGFAWASHNMNLCVLIPIFFCHFLKVHSMFPISTNKKFSHFCIRILYQMNLLFVILF